MRSFDGDAQFQSVKESAVAAVQGIFPIEGKTRTLRCDRVWVEDKAGSSDFAGQSSTKKRDGTWGAPVFAHLTLVDKITGKTLDDAPNVKLLTLPKVTDRSSYIVSGTEYQVSNQLRLKPGVYTLRKQNGELKTQVNLARGKNFDLAFNEASGIFTVQKVGGGQANIPLYPLLIHMGMSPSSVARAWSQDLVNANARFKSPAAVERAEQAFGAQKLGLKDYFSKTVMSTDTTKITLGEGFDKVDGPMLLAASQSLYQTHLGDKAPVDRDSMAFKELHSLEDFIHERLDKNKNELAFKIKRHIDNLSRTKITQLVNPGVFTQAVEGFFTQDDKSATPEQTNPLEMLAGGKKVTMMGKGGIGSTHAVTNAMRQIHPSHFGFIDPISSPESAKIGVNLHLPTATVKDGKELKTTLINAKNGKTEALSPTEAWNKYVAYPGESGATVKAIYQGKTVEVSSKKVDYRVTAPEALFSTSTNMIPFLSSIQGNRAMMASKQMEQAISLKYREAPNVQVGAHGTDRSMEQMVGEKSAAISPIDGVIKKITPDEIHITGAGGKLTKLGLYNNFSLNRKSYLHHEPLVKVGDPVKAGQVLADSNFSRQGTLALGINARVAYVPFKSHTFEDGIAISESAAQKLTSVHIHKKSFDVVDATTMSLAAYKSFYPNALSAENAQKLDSEGIVKKGQTVKQGDILIAALIRQTPNAQILVANKALSERPRDGALLWKMEDNALVQDVVRQGSTITVYLKTEEAAKVGDKLAGRFGNKGVITTVVPDAQVPHDKDGKPVEIMLNPHGVISRINVGQIYESAASKAIQQSGASPLKIQNFQGIDNLKMTNALMKKHGINDKEELFDPGTGKSLGQVHVGNPYILKLHKTSTSSYSAREGGAGSGYDMNQQPLKAGGDDAAKSMDLLTMYAMLSHGARANLREMYSVKSGQNDEYWKALKSGQQLPPPKSSFAYDKFMGYLRGAGVDVKKEGTKMTLAPLTDTQVLAQSSGLITKPLFYQAKNMTPIKGGFFDPHATGGFTGTKWAHMELHEPVVNPVFEDAAKKLLGIGGQFDQITAGKLFVSPSGALTKESKGGATGGAGIEVLLKKINVEKDLAHLSSVALTLKGDALDGTNKKLRYLQALKVAGLTPADAYIRRTVPVLPGQYRPVYPLPSGDMASSDINHLYQNAGIVNTMMKLPVMKLLHEDDKADIRKELHTAVSGISGLTDLNIKGKVREGFISEIKGGAEGQPKEGFFISKLLSRKQDFVGRGVIVPGTDLGVDEAGIPEEMCWKIFEPFVMRELTKMGKTPLSAKDEIKKRTDTAKKALEIVMADRHVLLNRSPSLHKFSIMAFKPKLVTGRSIELPHLVCQGFNADFDGDTMTVHTPISDAANEEAKKMLPSANLFKPGSGQLMIAPSQEAQTGLFYLSQNMAARAKLNAMLPKDHQITGTLDKKATAILLGDLARSMPGAEYAKIVNMMRDEGARHAYERGFTLGLNDLATPTAERNRIVAAAGKSLAKATTEAQAVAINNKANEMIDGMLARSLKGKNNPLYDMVDSGAKGNRSQLRQIMATPLMVADEKGRIVRSTIKKSYTEGLDLPDYWTSMYGARRGMMDRAVQTSLPGAFSKDIMATTIDNVISKDDCGTKDGIIEGIDDKDIVDRYLAGDQGGLKHNTLVDKNVASRLKKAGITQVKVRSPLKCLSPKGTCAHCFGLDEHGGRPEIGTNIGAKSGQAISEPLVQMGMNSFHSGGAVGSGSDVQGFARINQLLQMPKILAGAASLAPINGSIEKIAPHLGGGQVVTIGGQNVIVSRGRSLKFKVGDMVRRGDALTDGPIKPQDLVKLKGMEEAQGYLANQLRDTYKSQGFAIHKKIFETVVRSQGNTTQVLNNPKGSGYLPGDVAPWTAVQAYNKNLLSRASLSDASGRKLAESVSGIGEPGHVLSDADVRVLKARGLTEIAVTNDPIVHAPFLKSTKNIPMLRQDWMSALGYQKLQKTLTEGAAQGWSSDTNNYHPVPALAHGATFGQGKDGKY